MMRILDRVDDWINPIVVKELRQAVKSRMVVAILMLFLGVQLFLLGLYLLFSPVQSDDQIDWTAGNDVFRWQQGILLFTLSILVPAYAAIRLGAERSDNNVDLLFISTLHPRSIIAGKFFAALVLALLVFSTCAPFMTFTYLLRGIDIPTILTVLSIDLLLMLFSTMFALFLAAIPGPRALKIFVAFIGFVFLLFVSSYTIFGTVELIAGGGFWEWMVEQWSAVVFIVGGVLGLVGLFFVYSVALISPPSSNRILPVRIFLFVIWLALGVGLFLTSYYHNPASVTPIPLFFWVVGGSILVCIQSAISICERERWGPRVAMTIPKRLWLRLPAFLFYTGSAGGILFTVLLAGVTIGSVMWWCEEFAPGVGTPGYDRTWEALEYAYIVMSAVCLYTFCYGLTAILVRTHLLANQLKPSFTWLVGLLLVGLGSSVPAVIAYVFFSEQMRWQTDGGWWMLPNPFMAVYELTWGSLASRNNDEFRTLCFWFLGIWAVLVTVLSMPWYMAQVRYFRPATKRPVELAPVEVVPVSVVEPLADWLKRNPGAENKIEFVPVTLADPKPSVEAG